MTGYAANIDHQETTAYHGKTTAERTQWQGGYVQWKWICFDTNEKSVEFFDRVSACLRYLVRVLIEWCVMTLFMVLVAVGVWLLGR